MKLKCGLSPEEKLKRLNDYLAVEAVRLENWHDHFAWWPVRVGSNDCRWLETVERRLDLVWTSTVFAFTTGPGLRYDHPEYRAKEKK